MSSKATRILVKTGKILGYFVLGILLLFGAVWLAIQHPKVQTAITQKVTRSLSKKMGTTFRITGVDIDFFKTVVLEGIYLEDLRKDTLLYADELRVNIGLLSLMNKKVTVNLIGLEDATVNLYKAKGDSAFNYAFIPAAFASSDTTAKDTTSSPWTFDLEEVNLAKVKFTFKDEDQGSDLKLGFNELDIDLKTLGLQDQYAKVNSINVDGLKAYFAQTKAESDSLLATAAETAKLDTLTGAVKKAAADTLDQQFDSKGDTIQSAFNDSGWRLALGELNFRNTDLRYDVVNVKPTATGMDFSHLGVEDLILQISDVAVDSNDFALELKKLAFKEKSGFQLDQLAISFKADLPQALVKLNEFRTPNSVLDDGLAIQIPNIQDAKNFFRSVIVNAEFDDDYLSTKDAAYFTDALNAYPALAGKRLTLDGDIAMRDNEARMDNLLAQVDEKNFLKLNGVVRNLSNPLQTSVDISIVPLETSTDFISGLVPAGTLPPEFAKVGKIDLRADLRGELSKMNGFLSLKTSAGNIESDFVLGTDTSFQRQNFDANVNIDNLNLAQFLGAASGLGQVSLTAKAEGSRNGSDIAVRDGSVNLKRLDYNRYTYRNIRLKGSYLKEVANAVLQANDPNLQATIKAVADMGGSQPKFAVNANLREIDLWSLKLYSDTITIRGSIKANLTGTDPDAIVGKVALDSVQIQRPRQTYRLDTMSLALDKKGPVRIINLRSNILNAYAEGQFTVKELPVAMNLFVKKYLTNYPVTETKLAKSQTIWIDLRVNPYPTLLQALVPDLQIVKPITVKGYFASDSSRLNLEADVPQLGFGTQSVTGLQLRAGTTDDKLQFRAAAAQVKISDSSSIPTPEIVANIEEDDLQFKLRLASDEADSRLRLNGRFQMRKDSFIVSFEPSELRLKKQEWDLEEHGQIVYATKYLKIANLALERKGQKIAIDGNSSTALNVGLRNISIADVMEIVPAMGYKLDGLVNGDATLTQLFETPAVQADVKVDSFKVNQNTIGNIQLLADRQADGWIGLKATVLGRDNDIRADGRYHPVDTVNNVSLDIAIAKVALAQFTPFVKDQLEMSGNLNADLKLRGSVSNPDLTGQLTFAGPTVLRPKVLGAALGLTNQTIQFGNQQVLFNSFTLTDEENRQAVLNGNVNYRDLDKIALDLDFRTEGFHFLNASYGTGQPFYGDALISASVRILGVLDNLRIDGTVRTLEGTDLKLATYQTGGASVEQANYITFVDKDAPPEMQGNKKEEEEKVETPSGFALNAKVTVTPEAKVTVLLDPKTQDRIEAAGGGTFDIRFTPQGDLFVYGQYTIEDGGYFMNLFGAVKKEFEVRKGSTVTLDGPPADAKLDVTAVYEVETKLNTLLGDDEVTSNIANEEVPVGALINIKGNTESLDLGFDIEVQEDIDPQAKIFVDDRLNQIRQNQNELNQQIFSLIVFNRFMANGNFFAGGSSGGGGIDASLNENVDKSLSSFFSSQLSDISEDYLGVEIDVNLESQNENQSFANNLTDRNLGINLSKSLFNDRVSVSVGSNVNLGNSSGNTGAASTSAQNLIGDFTVSYKITPNGSMTLKFFRRNQIVLGIPTANEQLGASVAHSKSFNGFKELFTSRSRKRQWQKQKGEQEIVQ